MHMKVIIPAASKNTMEELEDLKKDNHNTTASVASEDIDELDAEIAQLLAPRRRRWASRMTYQPSPEISPRSSPTRLPTQPLASAEDSPSPSVSPLFFHRRSRFRTASPSSQRTISSLPNTGDRKQEGFRVFPPGSTLSTHLRNKSPARKVSFSNSGRIHKSKSPVQNNGSPTPSEAGRSQERNESPSNSQASRRPRVYCTHKRRTWSHLLDKR